MESKSFHFFVDLLLAVLLIALLAINYTWDWRDGEFFIAGMSLSRVVTAFFRILD